MKILILANIDMGLYKFRRELLETLTKEHKVFFCVPHGEFTKKIEDTGCKYIPSNMLDRRSTNPIKDLLLLFDYKKIVSQIKPDVVLTYTIKPNVYGGLVCRQSKISYIANITGLGTSIENGGLLSTISMWLYKIGLKKASCVFFQNEYNMTLFTEKGIVNNQAKIIPGSGVNLNEHNYEQYPDTDTFIRFLFIGRIMKDKGIDELLSAFDEVHKKYTNIRLDIVGGCDEQSYFSVLQEAQSVGYIKYHNQQENVHDFIKNTHCTVLPSYHEGIANVLLESAATGRPVIATRVPGCVETFDDEVSGIGCDARNINSLVEAIERFIELPHNKKKQMGIAGRKKMEKEFDRSIVINAYCEEIKKIHNNGGKTNVSL
ncbi:MAG: N,N'-diacetylbacillosaminyl-diphospho-undecaprenol alpha-1,3-N-acetylgalactosaminyltransferase [Firmicutes bacterium ADurb.Bin099]|nr:MAG: N,N'-diacetylbacillosaminyl-diphospho-undecaprenol alpha-1,3-N-acetylgalactosaminyltransferase [Firmicutes bacterium ADurb.Bin099]